VQLDPDDPRPYGPGVSPLVLLLRWLCSCVACVYGKRWSGALSPLGPRHLPGSRPMASSAAIGPACVKRRISVTSVVVA